MFSKAAACSLHSSIRPLSLTTRIPSELSSTIFVIIACRMLLVERSRMTDSLRDASSRTPQEKTHARLATTAGKGSMRYPNPTNAPRLTAIARPMDRDRPSVTVATPHLRRLGFSSSAMRMISASCPASPVSVRMRPCMSVSAMIAFTSTPGMTPHNGTDTRSPSSMAVAPTMMRLPRTRSGSKRPFITSMNERNGIVRRSIE